MRNVIVQFDGTAYWAFESNNHQELLGVTHSWEEMKHILQEQFESVGPKVGERYYYIHFGENFRNGRQPEIRIDIIQQDQVNYFNQHHQLPPNVYFTQGQAATAMQRLIGLFKDLRGKWELTDGLG